MIEILQYGLSPNRGGIETYLYKIWGSIDRTAFHFSFIDDTGADQLPCFYEELRQQGCTFYKVTPRRVSVRKNREEILKLFSDHHFDILHFNVNTLSYAFPIDAALRHHTKVIVHSRSSSMSAKTVTRLFHILNKAWMKTRRVTRIAISSAAGEWLFGKKPYEVYPNGVDTTTFCFDPEDRNSIRRELCCEKDLVVGHVGAFLPVKNQAHLIRMFSDFLRIFPAAKLWLVGDGPKRPEMEELSSELGLQDRVMFLGLRKDMAALYSGMDVFCLPSLFEGFSNAVLEAQCSGLSCLVSDRIPQEAIVTKHVHTLPLDEPAAWVEKLREIADTSLESRSDGTSEVERAGYSVNAEIKRLEDLYRSVCAKP